VVGCGGSTGGSTVTITEPIVIAVAVHYSEPDGVVVTVCKRHRQHDCDTVLVAHGICLRLAVDFAIAIGVRFQHCDTVLVTVGIRVKDADSVFIADAHPVAHADFNCHRRFHCNFHTIIVGVSLAISFCQFDPHAVCPRITVRQRHHIAVYYPNVIVFRYHLTIGDRFRVRIAVVIPVCHLVSHPQHKCVIVSICKWHAVHDTHAVSSCVLARIEQPIVIVVGVKINNGVADAARPQCLAELFR